MRFRSQAKCFRPFSVGDIGYYVVFLIRMWSLQWSNEFFTFIGSMSVPLGDQLDECNQSNHSWKWTLRAHMYETLLLIIVEMWSLRQWILQVCKESVCLNLKRMLLLIRIIRRNVKFEAMNFSQSHLYLWPDFDVWNIELLVSSCDLCEKEFSDS